MSSSIQNAVPDCAQSCLSTYVSQTFTNCSSGDLTCMCTEYSSQGYTLGELAYLCVKVNCSSNITAQAAAYSICNAQSGSVPALHSSVLTQPPTSTLQPTSTTTTTVVGTGAATSSKATKTPAVTSGLIITATTTVTTSVGSQATGTNDTGRAGGPLTTEQAIGIIVGAMGGLLLLLGLIFCCICCRRRKAKKDKKNKKNHNSYDFVDKEPRRAWRMKYASFGDRPAENQQPPVSQQPVTEKKEAARPTAYMQDGDVERNQHPPASRGTQATHESTRPASRDSRASITSARTISQLLPDKPTIVHIQPPSRSHTVSRKDSRPGVPQKSPNQTDLYTPATVFEEDRPAFVPGLPANPGVYRAYKASAPQPAELSTARPTERSHQPSLSLEIPRTASKPIPKAATAWPPPVNVDQGGSTATTTKPKNEKNAISKPKPSPSNVSLLDYYAHSNGSAGSAAGRSTPSDEAEQRRRAVPQALVIKKAEPRPPVSRQSSASDTSFESIGDDDPTPPAEAEKQLTPVAETSPISDIRYPKVPRSSNQAVSRSPRLAVPAKRSDSSIGVARRSPENTDSRRRAQPLTPDRQNFRSSPSLGGTTITHHQNKSTQTYDPDNGLRILNSYDPSHQNKALQQKASGTLRTPPASPLHGYEKNHGTTATSTPPNNTRRGPNGRLVLQMDKTKAGMAAAAPESPRWAPKLTPQRQGDDLYLSVSVGSPLYQSQFPASAYTAPAAPQAR